MSLFRKMKVSQRDNALSMTETERQVALETAKMDRYDIWEFLNGDNLMLIEGEMEELEKVACKEIIEALILYGRRAKQKGIDEEIAFLQRIAGFDKYENPASRIVSGIDFPEIELRAMPENDLREWLIEYILLLTKAKRKTRESNSIRYYGGLFFS